MRNLHGYRPPGGIRVRNRQQQPRHYLASPPTPPRCDEHDTELVEITADDLPDAFEGRLRQEKELLACPQCFPSDDDPVDVAAVADEIASNWNHYKQYFNTGRGGFFVIQ